MLKINQIAIISGGLLLLVLAMPSYVFMIFETSSMAAGIFILACTVFLIYFCLIVLTSSHKFSPVNSQSALIILWLIFLHGIIAYIFLDGFDLRRFFLSYLLFLQVIVAAIMFLQMALNISNEAVNASIKFAFYILFFSGVAATFGLNPWAINRHKPVFFFAEPSHYAMVFLPLLLYMQVISTTRIWKFILVLSSYFLAFSLESMLLLIGITAVFLLSLPLTKFFMTASFMIILIVFNSNNLEYYISRVNFSDSSENFSTLAFLSGWERTFLNLYDTFLFGVGFQQFGIVGNQGVIQDKLRSIGAHGLNLLDGGALATKLLGELGLIGIILLILYINYFLKSFIRVRKFLLGHRSLDSYLEVYFLSIFLMYSMDLFFRSAGYFSSSGFLFIVSILWMLSKKLSNYKFSL